MKKLKVVTIVGTRPEIIRLSRLIPKLDEITDHVLVHTGQNYDRQLSDVFFEDLELRTPDYYLNVDTTSFGTVMGDTLKKSEEVLLKEKPDAVLILGDTNSAIAAVVAERMHIPVYHMEAGNRSFDNNVPEELNRKLVDHVATFNLPYNDYSLRNLRDEGIQPKFIHKTGSPMGEILSHYRPKISESSVLEALGLKSKSYLLVSLHRQENVDSESRLENIMTNIVLAAKSLSLDVLMSTHPRTRKRLEKSKASAASPIMFHEPFGYLDYNKLQLESYCVISDSGSVSEEASLLGFPAVVARSSTERPEALESSKVLLSPPAEWMDLELYIGVARQMAMGARIPEGYDQDDFSGSVIGFLLSTVRESLLSKNVRRLDP